MLKSQLEDINTKYNEICEAYAVSKTEIVQLKGEESLNELKTESTQQSNSINTNIVTNTKNMESAITEITDDVYTVKSELNNLKQHNMYSDIIITGIPETNNESLIEKVNLCLVSYDVQIQIDDFKQIYRLKNHNNCGANTPILIEFKSENVKYGILNKQKQMGPILLQSVDKNLPATDMRKVFFKHRLTKENLSLVRDARKFGRDYNYQFVWTQGSKILIKKTSNSRTFQILTVKDLENLKNNQ